MRWLTSDKAGTACPSYARDLPLLDQDGDAQRVGSQFPQPSKRIEVGLDVLNDERLIARFEMLAHVCRVGACVAAVEFKARHSHAAAGPAIKSVMT
jgi:hypothetical protein